MEKKSFKAFFSFLIAFVCVGLAVTYVRNTEESVVPKDARAPKQGTAASEPGAVAARKAESLVATSTDAIVQTEASVVVPDAKQERSDENQTADPNREPDNALAGITYRDVQMWELAALKIPEKLKGGVLISKIHAKSSFAESQIMPGDIVTRAHHTKIVSFTDLENVVKDRKQTMLDVYRNGTIFQVVLHRPFRE